MAVDSLSLCSQDDDEPSRAAIMEAELRNRLDTMVEERARAFHDRDFLQHFAEAARLSAQEQLVEASTASQALQKADYADNQAREELRRARQEWENGEARLRMNKEAEARAAANLQQLQRYTASEVNRFQNLIAAEEHARKTATAQKVASLQDALEAAKSELAIERGAWMEQKRIADETHAALVKVRSQSEEREALLQDVLRETLARLEADFARERAAHDALIHRTTRRLKPAKSEEEPAVTGAASSQEPKAAPGLRSSPSDPVFVRSTAAQEAYDAAIKGVAAAAAAMNAADAGFIEETLASSSEPAVPSNAHVWEDFSKPISSENVSPLVEHRQTVLEQEVAQLRKKQEAFEAIWKKKAQKHRGDLIEDHIAALAARAARTPASADVAHATSSPYINADSAEGAAARISRRARPIAVNGLLYV